MDAAIALLADHNVQAYFLVLGLAIHRCIKIYFGKFHQSTDGSNIKSQDTAKPSIIPLVLSIAIIGITWYLILRFILTNLHTSTSYFDDAYKDVLRAGHYFTSTQLLTWAIVAVVWVASEGHMERDVAFLLFGFLGAMGAAFAVWVPTLYHRYSGRKKRTSFVNSDCVPITYAITSMIAFISILKLQPCDRANQECTPEEGFGTFHVHFRQWLQCLHVILVAPVLVSLVLPANALPRVPSSLLFAALAVVSASWHVYQIKEGAKYIIPRTDCQISITTDLVCCSFVTLFAICKDTITSSKSRAMDRSDDGISEAFTRICLAAIAIPIISPAAVLATHLCLSRFGKTYLSFIAFMQQKVASKLRSGDVKESRENTKHKMWCNLGLWTTDKCGYNKACENLAEELGKLAELNSSDAALSCGCGSIDEARYYKKRFELRHITGIDPNLAEARTTDMDDFNVRTIRASVEDLRMDENEAPLFPPQMFDKIMALDNVYHYECKASFFRDCLAMLPDGGKVAVSDVVLRQNNEHTPTWVKLALRLMGVSTNNGLWSVEEYTKKLALLGFDRNVKIELVGESVFKGWDFLPASLLRYLDYALIVARKSKVKISLKEKKKRIAIIGSGLAGLSTAHYLLSSKDAATLDIDIYEANSDCPGLAGNTHLIGEQLIDVPARMACLGYYNQYRQLIEELDIQSTVVRTDSSFYGDDGHGSFVCHSYDQSSLVNIYNAVFVGGLRRLWQMFKALSRDRNQNNLHENVSFGEWLEANLGLSREKVYQCKRTGAEKPHDLPSLTCHDNPFAYIMVGALSWMLSCTWVDLLKYPADIVLPYCKGLRMDRLGVGRQGQVIRIVPSIKVLERTLLYGVRNLHLGSRVSYIGANKVINGVVYDAVVVATEAKAVSKVLKNAPSVFGKIAYHPSTIYLHTDETFMPPNKKDWKCWNVEMSSGRREPQLTFWLNKFYPDSRFVTNVFQTWAPTHVPMEGTVIKRSDFERVIHSKESRSYIDAIDNVQGKDGIYFAGSYVVYGMGLLEQALISGKNASKKLLNNLSQPVSPSPLTALVIGAGPSGLVAAKYLLASTDPSYDVTIAEESGSIGGTFVNKVYDNCKLVSSKYLTAFSDHRMAEDTAVCPDHPSAEQYVEYLESYADRFCLRKSIKFNCQVVSIKDADDGVVTGDSKGYVVQCKLADGQVITKNYDVVAVCSGLHNVPYIPRMFMPSSETKDGFLNKYKGKIIHSSQYKDSSIFADKRVLVLGCGETAMDIVHRAILHPSSKSVALSVRRGFLSIPHNLAKDRPLDVFITNLFEHAYEHPYVHALRLRWHLSTIFIRMFLLLTGSSHGFNQWAAPTTPVRRGYHIINKSSAAMSHLNVPIKQMSIWGRFWLWVYGESHLRPIQTFHKTQVVGVEDDGVTVRFCDGRAYQAELIILATGYKQSFPFLDRKIRREFQEENMKTKAKITMPGVVHDIEEDYLPAEHFIVGKLRPRLGFIGFVRPNVGAIPPMSEIQVMWWLERMRGRVQTLEKPGSYMVLARKYSYGVDYGNYMHRVAEDFGAAPTLSVLAKSSSPLKALYTYCIGQSMVPLFRLQGPYESEDCWKIVVGELWRVCIRRGWAENAGLLFMTWLSLLMNAAACLLEILWCTVTLTRPKLFARY